MVAVAMMAASTAVDTEMRDKINLPASMISNSMTEVVNLLGMSYVHNAEVVNRDLAEARRSCIWEVKLRSLKECKHRSINEACDGYSLLTGPLGGWACDSG